MKEETEIIGIDVVCAQGADTFNIGQKGIDTIKEEICQIGKDVSATFYVCYNKDGKRIFKISAHTPTVIKWK